MDFFPGSVYMCLLTVIRTVIVIVTVIAIVILTESACLCDGDSTVTDSDLAFH